MVLTNCGYVLIVDDFLGTHLRGQFAMGVLWREFARRAQLDRAARQRADLELFRARAGTDAFTTSTAKATTPEAGR